MALGVLVVEHPNHSNNYDMIQESRYRLTKEGEDYLIKLLAKKMKSKFLREVILLWVFIVGVFIVVIIIGIILFFTYFYHDKDRGKKFFEESEKPFNKKAPEMYYHKQRMYRLCYGFFIGIHYLLLVMSISFTTITIYMVMDEKLDIYIRIFISVMAAISTTLQTVLRFDKVGEGYICAMRIIEQAILEYENRENETLEILLQANIKAEEIIHNMHQ